MTAPFPTFETFAGREGESFEVTGPPDVAVTMVLTSVTRWGSGRGFTVHFHGPLEPLLPQSIYHFDAGFDLFIVPLGPDEGRLQYEAIFT